MNDNFSPHLRPVASARRRAASAAAGPDSARGGAQEDVPHPPACRCTMCHLRQTRFPRRQDGRIVLPDPLAAARAQESARSAAAIPRRGELGLGGGRPPQRGRAHSSAYGDGGRGHGPREGPAPRDLGDDRGEGPSTGLGMGQHRDSRSGMAMDVRDPRARFVDDAVARHTGDPYPLAAARETTRNRHASLTDRARPHRTSKPYESKSNRPDPWPRIATIGQHDTAPRHQAQHLPTAYEDLTSNYPTASLGKPQRDSWPNPNEILGVGRSSCLTESSISLGTVSNSSTLSHTLISQDRNNDAKHTRHHPLAAQGSRPSSSQSSQYRHPSLLPSNQQPTNPSYSNASSTVEASPQIIRYNSRPRFSQPELWTQESKPDSKTPDTPPDMAYNQGARNTNTHYSMPATARDELDSHAVDPSAIQSPPSHQHEHPFAHSHLSAQPQSQEQELPAAPLRFQSPVTPQIHVANATRPKTRAMSVVHVKWDSDRKRRQGYFSTQDEGDEKSPFRHYNKTGCD